MEKLEPSALSPKRRRTLHTSNSSDVYVTTTADGTEVVVKRTKITCPGDMKRFDKELEFLQACVHECLLRPLALVRSPPTYAIVLPVFARGSLFGLLHASGRSLSVVAKLSMCRDVACAIAHLHDCGVLHRDVKTDNVLVDDAGRAVLADLNAAEWESLVTSDIVMQTRPTGGFFKQFVVGTLPYMAPELLRSVRGATCTRACDVYSFGVSLNEVLTQTVPYSDARTDQMQLHTILEARYNYEALTAAITADGLRPAQLSTAARPHVHAELLSRTASLACRCWSDRSADRPTMPQSVAELSELLETLGGDESGVAVEGGRGGYAPGGTARRVGVRWHLFDESDEAEAAVAEAAGETAKNVGVARLPTDLDSVDALTKLLDLNDVPTLLAASDATAGRRGADRMEDRCVLCARSGVTLAAVFDGHNGDAAAEYARVHLASRLQAHWAQAAAAETAVAAAAASAMRHTFLALNDGFLGSASADDSGCTALAAVCLPSVVTIANAGDCQCHLWRGTELVRLTVDHTAAVPSERARVEAAGAQVTATADGKLRVGGIIQVTRCLGDRPLRRLGLISEPEIHQFAPAAEDNAIVIASDGLWDVMPPERVLHCLVNTAKSPDLMAKRMVTEALDRGADDNITVVVVFLRDLA